MPGDTTDPRVQRVFDSEAARVQQLLTGACYVYVPPVGEPAVVPVSDALALIARLTAGDKGCPCPSHHPSCDCGGAGGDR